MAKMVHARLDDSAHQLLQRLKKETGLSESEILRRGLEAFAARLPQRARTRVVGVGKFESGVRDLGSDKRYLKGFGRS